MQREFHNGSTSSGYMQQDTEASFDEDEYWPIQSRELNRRLAGLDPHPSSESNWLSRISEHLFDGPLSAEPMQQTPRGNQYNTSSFPQTNIPTPNTNNLASEGIYSPSHPLKQPPTNIYSPYAGYPIEPAPHSVYNPNGLAFEHEDPIFQHSAPRVRNESATQSQPPEKKERRSLRSRPSRGRPSSAANTAAAGKSNELSKLSQRRAALGGRMGNDRREKAPVQRVDGVLYGLVDGNWGVFIWLICRLPKLIIE